MPVQQILTAFYAQLTGASPDQRAQQIEFLRAENRMLRSRLAGGFRATLAERAKLLKLGKPLGSAIKDLITVVSPRTFARWLNEEGSPRKMPTSSQGGRPRVKEDVQTLVLRLADENGWGYARIFAELKKLGVRLSKTSVANILRENGRGTGDDRGEGTWAEFLK